MTFSHLTSTAALTNDSRAPKLIDARGTRFGAAVTSLILASALVTHSVSLVLISFIFFLIGSVRGPQFTPQGLIFSKFVKPLLKGEIVKEDILPPRFAQQVGLLFTTVAVVAGFALWSGVFLVAVSACLAAATLNALFNFCLGCEIYLLIARLR